VCACESCVMEHELVWFSILGSRCHSYILYVLNAIPARSSTRETFLRTQL
jgi:hypothetical protein